MLAQRASSQPVGSCRVGRRGGAAWTRTSDGLPDPRRGSGSGHPPGEVRDARRVLDRAAASPRRLRTSACGRSATCGGRAARPRPLARGATDRAVGHEQHAGRRSRSAPAATTSVVGPRRARHGRCRRGTAAGHPERSRASRVRGRRSDDHGQAGATGRIGRRHAGRLARDGTVRPPILGAWFAHPLALAALATVAVPGLDAFDVRRPAQPGSDYDTAVVIDAHPQPVGRPRAAARRGRRRARGRGRPARACSAAEAERRTPALRRPRARRVRAPARGRPRRRAPRDPRRSRCGLEHLAARARPRRRRSAARSPPCTSCRPASSRTPACPSTTRASTASAARPRSTRPRAPARSRPRCCAAGRTGSRTSPSGASGRPSCTAT